MRTLAVALLLLASSAAAQDGTLTWTNAGGDQNWQAGETVADVDLDEIKTEVDACVSLYGGDQGSVVCAAGTCTLEDVISDLGDCNGPACFTGASGTKLDSNTDFTIEVDENNDGTNVFQIFSGDASPPGTQVTSIDEDGDLQLDGVITSDGPGTSDFDGPLTGPSFTADASATPTIGFDDTVASDTGGEAKVEANAVADDNGSISLQVEAGSDNTYVEAFRVFSTSGVVAGVQSGKVDRNNIAVDDDDCTGEQGQLWYDSTDSAFEFCNANSGVPDVLGAGGGTEVRSITWNADDLSADGTKCANATQIQITNGPKFWTIACADSVADGYIHGSVILPDSINIAANVTFELNARVVTDNAGNTAHGYMEIHCVAPDGVIDNSWASGTDLDITQAAGDVANDLLQDTSGAVGLGQGALPDCLPGDMLFWRWKMCANDVGAPSTGCTDNIGAEDDMDILGFKMEWTSDIGD